MTKEIQQMQLRFYTDEEIDKLAMVHIVEAETVDEYNRPIPNGLYDGRMGPIDRSSYCITCGLSEFKCPGHLGCIPLTKPCYQPMLCRDMVHFLQACCAACNRFRMHKYQKEVYVMKLMLLEAGLLEESIAIDLEAPYTRYMDLEDELAFSSKMDLDTVTFFHDKLAESVQEKIIEKARQEGYKSVEEFLSHSEYIHSTHIHAERMQIVRNFFAECKANSCSDCKHGKTSAKFESLHNFAIFLTMSEVFSTDMLSNANFIFTRIRDSKNKQKGKNLLMPWEVKEFIETVWENEKQLTIRLFSSNSIACLEPSPSMFFISKVLVPANKFRPPMMFQGKLFGNSLNSSFRDIIKANLALKGALEFYEKAISKKRGDIDTRMRSVNHCVEAVQKYVNALIDANLNKNDPRFHNASFQGIKNNLEKKEGMFRMYMMGKRVNFAARSVILPDPNISTDEVSIPRFFAQTLSFPEYVNDYNIERLRSAIINGASEYPGANLIERANGSMIDLKKLSAERRNALAKLLRSNSGDKVHRHVLDNDVVIMNRQPTLHRPSIMGHKARVISDQKIIRIHYSNCKSYNADFDGDEMNMHLAQNHLARSEGYNLMMTSTQYIVPTSGEPIRGLIQDHIVSGVLLTMKDTFVTREELNTLIYGALHHVIGSNKIHIAQPCIMKPVPLWSGKQIVSTVIKTVCGKRNGAGLNLDSRTKIKPAMWGDHVEEGTVIIRDNEMLTGVLDKSQIGDSSFGLIHACFECFGNEAASEMLTCITRLCTLWLQFYGFTCGLDDCLLSADADRMRRTILDEGNNESRHTTAEFAGLQRINNPRHYDKKSLKKYLSSSLHTDFNKRRLDAAVKTTLNKYTSEVIKSSIPKGQMKSFPNNFLTLMTESGAKGSLVNASQIACLLGQQEFEGQRVKPMVSGKTLPSFDEYDTSAIAGGYIASRFLTGIKPQEYFFHCMAGRDGLTDTAVKTARSGYLQRCLIKHLENISVKYDETVRDSFGSVLQFQYGGDSIDPVKTSFIDQHKFLAMNSRLLSDTYHDKLVKKLYGVEKHIEKSVVKHNKLVEKGGGINNLRNKIIPVVNRFDPANTVGAISERYQEDLNNYITNNPDGLVAKEGEEHTPSMLQVSEEALRRTFSLKNMHSVIEPGEAVGILAAQSIGEPSTQMTLNTFHFAGLDMAHVTVGIPRLRELLMSGAVAKRLATLPLRDGTNKEYAERIAASISDVTFHDILENVNITEQFLYDSNGNKRNNKFTISAKFDVKDLADFYSFPIKKLFKHRVATLLVSFCSAVDSSLKDKRLNFRKVQKRGSDFNALIIHHTSGSVDMDLDSDEFQPRKKKTNESHRGMGIEDDDEEEDSMIENDLDEEDGADAERAAARSKQFTSYDDDEEEEEEEDDSDDDDTNEQESKKKSINQDADDGVVPMNIDTDHTRATAFDGVYNKFGHFCSNIKLNQRTGLLEFVLDLSTSSKRIFLSSIFEEACMINRVQGIGRTHVIETGNEIQIQLEGRKDQPFKVEQLWQLDRFNAIDFNNMFFNDIKQIINTYGIEAGRTAIVKEVLNVFNIYGIPVNERHIGLIADYMTYLGEYHACNRHHLKHLPGPFHKATFETATQFIKDAALYGEIDPVTGPSSKLVLGQAVDIGSGSFDIFQDLHTE